MPKERKDDVIDALETLIRAFIARGPGEMMELTRRLNASEKANADASKGPDASYHVGSFYTFLRRMCGQKATSNAYLAPEEAASCLAMIGYWERYDPADLGLFLREFRERVEKSIADSKEPASRAPRKNILEIVTYLQSRLSRKPQS